MKVLGDFHGDVFAVEGFEAFDQIFGVVDFCVGPNLLAERDARGSRVRLKTPPPTTIFMLGWAPTVAVSMIERTLGASCWLAPKINSTSGR